VTREVESPPGHAASEPRGAPRQGRVISLNIARAQPLRVGGREVMSGIGKRPVAGRVAVGALGIAGDEQADLSVHGGPAKAVYAYPHEHFPFWQTVRAQARVAGWGDTLAPGMLGENLTLTGLLEDEAFIGDVLRFADCELAVSEPRLPCAKFGAAMGFTQAVKLMAANGWCGFYLAVRTPGTLAAGEAFEVIAGPREVGIAELFRARVGRNPR
jgi:MOSC domain-containing protein YiiM